MKTISNFAFILIALAPTLASAQIVIQHIGANDPESEGFNAGPFGDVVVGPMYEDFGRDTWSFESKRASNYYTHQVSAIHQQAALDHGWSLSAELRFVTAGEGRAILDFGADLRSYRITFELNSDGDILARSFGNIIYNFEKGGTDYHTYAVVYDALDETASLWIDGSLRVSNLANNLSSPAGGLIFGMFGLAHANWSDVSLTIIPEPATAALWAGTGALLMIGAFRWRKRRNLEDG